MSCAKEPTTVAVRGSHLDGLIATSESSDHEPPATGIVDWLSNGTNSPCQPNRLILPSAGTPE